VDPPVDPPPAPPQAKSPEPEEAALASILDQVQAESAGKPPGKLIAEATARPSYDVESYALLRLARDSAATLGDLRTAFLAVEEMDTRFVVDALAMKVDVLPKMQANASEKETFRQIAESALTLVDEAISARRFDVAQKCANMALVAARKASNSELAKKATMKVIEIQESRSDAGTE